MDVYNPKTALKQLHHQDKAQDNNGDQTDGEFFARNLHGIHDLGSLNKSLRFLSLVN
jgi:hypothetical protein